MHKLFLASILIVMSIVCELWSAGPISSGYKSSSAKSSRYGIGGLSGSRPSSGLLSRSNNLYGGKGLMGNTFKSPASDLGNKNIYSKARQGMLGGSTKTDFGYRSGFSKPGAARQPQAKRRRLSGEFNVEGLKTADIGAYNSGDDMEMAPKSKDFKGDLGKLRRDMSKTGDWDRKDSLNSDLKAVHDKFRQSDSLLLDGSTYLMALSENKDTHLDEDVDETDERSTKVVTLVPKEQNQLRSLMLNGEEAFKEENYGEAIDYFKLAKNFAPNSPEISLSLFNCHFAANTGISYGMVAYYLRRSLQQFPELATVDVHPKYFYSNPATYIRDLVKLEDYLEENPKDPDALFVMSYLKWRDGKPADAKTTLKQVFELVQDKGTLEAVDIFWDGMCATGAVKGQLAPRKPKPQPATKKAAEAAKAAK